MSKLLAALVSQEVFYQTSLLTSVTEPLGNIVPWDKNTGTAESGCMTGALPPASSKEGNRGGGVFS